MKRIGIGFTAIIAILAMSFTFASKTHTAKHIVKDDPSVGCFTSIRAESLITPPAFHTYTSNFLQITGIKTLTQAQALFPAVLTSAKNYVVTSVGLELPDPANACIWVANIKQPICCYELKAVPVTGGTVYKVDFIRFGNQPQ